MRYLSLFSGLEAATVAWSQLGWHCVAVAEIEPFPCAVLAHHYPATPNLGDVTKITAEQIKNLGPIDLVVFGSPCQDLSVAGKRQGLEGERSGLFYAAMRIVAWARQHNGCRFALWENVPGAFSSNQGRDFAAVVANMAGCGSIDTPKNGWGTEGAAVGDDAMVEWSVLDAQWNGLAQRRKRVFALADFGDWFCRPPILLEPSSLRGDSAPSRDAAQVVAATLEASAGRSRGAGTPVSMLVPFTQQRRDRYLHLDVASTKTAHNSKDADDLVIAFNARQDPSHSTEVFGCLGSAHPQAEAVCYALPGNWINRAPENGGNATEPPLQVSPCLTRTDVHAVCFQQNASGELRESDVCYTLNTNSNASGRNTPLARTGLVVRRLTPLECERLQGFSDTYTKITYRKKAADLCPDSPRYKALGNSMAVSVMAWIGRSIAKAMAFQNQESAA